MQLRIVIADGDRKAVRSIAAVLRDAGHETRGVYHGLDVVAAVGSFAADMLLVDVGITGMTGYAIARALRQRYGSALPTLIAASAGNDPTERLLAELAGFEHHLSKPYEAESLLGLFAVGSQRRPTNYESRKGGVL